LAGRLARIRELCSNPRVVLDGGGNFSVKEDNLTMHIKPSGVALSELTPEQLVAVNRGILAFAITYDYGRNPLERERQYADFLRQSRTDQSARTPSVETIVHQIFPFDYVLHTHDTFLTALLCASNSQKLVEQLFGEAYICIPYCDPGILLGKALDSQVRERPCDYKGCAQLNHGFFFASSDFDKLMQIHKHANSEVLKLLVKAAGSGKLDNAPFGQIIQKPQVVTESIANKILDFAYEAVFSRQPEQPKHSLAELGTELRVYRLETQDAVLYLNTTCYARQYAASEMAKALAGRFSWLSPDHMVWCGVTDGYIKLGSLTDQARIRQSIIDQIKANPESKNIRTYTISGIGMVTIGGHIPGDNPEVNARYATQLANDALLVQAYAGAISPDGVVVRVTEKNAAFIRDWQVEAERRKVATETAK
jgi:rhamnose utilization protein RhaD (predicted bifunctional aldolase and dehydrogenase)